MENLTICIVTFRTDHEILLKCLSSIRSENRRGHDIEIVVIDNSADESLAAFREQVDTWVSMPTNEGFALAANRGVAAADREWVLILNPDAALQQGALQALFSASGKAPRKSLFCGWLEINAGVQVDAFMLWWTSTGRALRRSRYRRRLESRANGGDEVIAVEKVSGGALFGRREILRDLGPFDERFFLYGEDVDLSLRAARAGVGLYAVPRARVAHVGASSKQDHSFLVEAARTDAALRLNSYHLPRILALASRLELLATTWVGMIPGLGRSSGSNRVRQARLSEFRRWGIKRDLARFDPRQRLEDASVG